MIEVNKPYIYKLGEDDRYLLPLGIYDEMSLYRFKVGNRSFDVLTSATTQQVTSGALLDAYKAAWESQVPAEIYQNHLAVVAKESTLRFHMVNLTSSNEVLIDISDGGIARPARNVVAAEMIYNTVESFFVDLGDFSNANAARAIEKRGWKLTTVNEYSGHSLYISPKTNPGYYIPAEALYGMVMPNSAISYQGNPKWSLEFNAMFDNLVPGKTRWSVVAANPSVSQNAEASVRSDLLMITQAQWEAAYPELVLFKQKIAALLGVDQSTLAWEKGTASIMGSFCLICSSAKYTTAKSGSLGPVSFRVPIGLDVSGTNLEWKFKGGVESSVGREIVASEVHTFYSLDTFKTRVTGSETDELITFITDHPGAAVAYSYHAEKQSVHSSAPLEESVLYLDARKSDFDLYAQTLWENVTFKTASNKAKEHVFLDKPFTSIRFKVFPDVSLDWTYAYYALASWQFSNNGVVVGTYKDKTLSLNAAIPEHGDDIELALRLGITKTFQTTLAEFLQLWFGVTTVDALSEYGAGLSTVDMTAYNLDPIELSSSGMTTNLGLSSDQYKRLLFIHANTTTMDLIRVIEAAITVHFTW